MNLKLLEIMHENAEAFFSFAEEALNARDPGNLTSVWTKHAQNQMQLISKHGMELVGLGQKIASTSMNNMSDRR